MTGMSQCDRCGGRIPSVECVSHGSRKVCEDCAMDLLSPAKVCDPWAVKMASGSFEAEADAVATLQGLEKKLYDLVSTNGRVPFEELPGRLEVSQTELNRAVATLRHMELVRGHRRDDGGADCVLFTS